LLEYDDVINKHREIIYGRRNNILSVENINDNMKEMISSQVKKIVLSENNALWGEIDKIEVIKKIQDLLWVEIIEDKIESDDVVWINNINSMSEYLSNLSIEALDKIKDEAKDKTDFYEIQKKIVLSSIDDLWMRHIDSMSRLREEVAFEWYAQKQPLVVYKEKAFNKFNDLLNEIEYKSIKAMFGVTKISEVDNVDFSSLDIEVNDISIDNMINNFSSEKAEEITKIQSNPLFNDPNQKNNKTKIRI